MAQAPSGASAAPPPDAVKAVQAAIAKARDWGARMGKVHNMIAQDILHPQESQYQIWGMHLLPTADMSVAQGHLQTMEHAIHRLAGLTAEMGKPGFLSSDKTHVERVGQDVTAAMTQAHDEGRAAANAVQHANMKVVNRDIGVAEGALAADKFIVDKAPEVMGDIMFAITKSEHAKSLVTHGAKFGLNVVTHISADAQGINIDGEVDSIAKAGFEAAVDIIADLVPGAKGKVKAALSDLVKDILKDVAKNAPGKHGKELQAVCLKATNDAVTAALEKLAMDNPILKDSKLRKALLKPVLKAVLGAEKAAIEGKPASEGFKDGLQKGAVSVAFGHGKDKAVHGASDYAAHDHADHSAAGAHPPRAAGGGGRPDATKAAKDAWIKEHLKIDVAAQASHAGH